jgi:hypothetical protein
MPVGLKGKPLQAIGRYSIAVLILSILMGALIASQRSARTPAPRPAVLSSHTPRMSEERCAECHQDIVAAHRLSPHARTLARVTDGGENTEFAETSFRRDDLDLLFRYATHDGKLMVSTSSYARPLPIEWIFGSGTHARTPLLTWVNEEGTFSSIEHGVSSYAQQKLGVTLGLEDQTATVGLEALGHPRSSAETINCFGCHATSVPTDNGRILFDHVETGVGCARCHWNAPQHVRDVEAGVRSSIEKFSQLSPRESVDRCGECHRRTNEVGGTVDANDKSITRFASVGLVQSPCFLRQEEITLADGQPARFDCLSCHDPHRPTERDWRFHAAVCLKCHDAGHRLARDCSVASRDDNCLTCHMPKVPSNPHLAFTDHWIRIRERKQP